MHCALLENKLPNLSSEVVSSYSTTPTVLRAPVIGTPQAPIPLFEPSPPSCPSSAITMLLQTKRPHPLSALWTRAPTTLRSEVPRRAVELPSTPTPAGWDPVGFSASCKACALLQLMSIVNSLILIYLLYSILIAVAAYFIGGCAYQRTVMHQRGWRQCPNFSLWAGMFDFVKVSLLALVPCRSRQRSRYGHLASPRGLPTSRLD